MSLVYRARRLWEALSAADRDDVSIAVVLMLCGLAVIAAVAWP